MNNATGLGKGWLITSVNGANNTQNNYQMDGAPINNWASFNVGNDSGFFASLPVPNPDTIQEFKIQTSGYDASYGRNAGANVNVITKSGTNRFHGSALEFFRNTALNANEWFFKRNQLNPGNTPVQWDLAVWFLGCVPASDPEWQPWKLPIRLYGCNPMRCGCSKLRSESRGSELRRIDAPRRCASGLRRIEHQSCSDQRAAAQGA